MVVVAAGGEEGVGGGGWRRVEAYVGTRERRTRRRGETRGWGRVPLLLSMGNAGERARTKRTAAPTEGANKRKGRSGGAAEEKRDRTNEASNERTDRERERTGEVFTARPVQRE